MGNSFIGIGRNKLAVRNATLGLICAVIAKEFESLPQDSGLRSVVQPLRDSIEKNAFYTGYSTSIDLADMLHSQEQADAMAEFLDLVISKLNSFGKALPKEYLHSLPYGQYFQKEIWLSAFLIEQLTALKGLLCNSK